MNTAIQVTTATKFLLEDLASIFHHYRDEAIRVVIQCRYEIGERIEQHILMYAPPIMPFLHDGAKALGRKVRTLYESRTLYNHIKDKYDNNVESFVSSLPDGVNWTWIRENRLTEHREKEEGKSIGMEVIRESSVFLLPIPSSYDDTLDGPCPICGKRPCERAHFPRTVKRGAKEDEWIPMCHECHMSLHDMGVNSFFEVYKNNIFGGFIYPLIRGLFYERINKM